MSGGRRRFVPESAGARIANAEGLVTQLDALSPGEERLNAVIASAPVAVLEVDLDTRVVRWNARQRRLPRMNAQCCSRSAGGRVG